MAETPSCHLYRTSRPQLRESSSTILESWGTVRIESRYTLPRCPASASDNTSSVAARHRSRRTACGRFRYAAPSETCVRDCFLRLISPYHRQPVPGCAVRRHLPLALLTELHSRSSSCDRARMIPLAALLKYRSTRRRAHAIPWLRRYQALAGCRRGRSRMRRLGNSMASYRAGVVQAQSCRSGMT